MSLSLLCKDRCSCKQCKLWLDGCILRWECDRPNVTVVGYFSGINWLVGSGPSGSSDSPGIGLYRLYSDGVLISSLTIIDQLPVECCKEDGNLGGARDCRGTYPNIEGLRVMIVGLGDIFMPLNGLYVIGAVGGEMMATNFMTPSIATITNPCFECGITPIGLDSYDIEYNLITSCGPNQPPTIPPTIFNTRTAYHWLGCRVTINAGGSQSFRCAQSARVQLINIGRSTRSYLALGKNCTQVCSHFVTPIIKDNLNIGCNDPLNDIPVIDCSDVDFASAKAMLTDCVYVPAFCCSGGIF